MKEKFDYGDFPITKLPPGKAAGADGLMRWSQNRSVGVSGTSASRMKAVVLWCSHCGHETRVKAARGDSRRKRKGMQCRNCGNSGVLKVKRGKN